MLISLVCGAFMHMQGVVRTATEIEVTAAEIVLVHQEGND